MAPSREDRVKVWRYDLVPSEVAEAESDEEKYAAWQALGHMPGSPGFGYDASVEMPTDATILSINFSTKGVSIYALTEGIEGAESEVRRFYVAGNDVELPDGANELTWRGTAKVAGGPTAHVFEPAVVTADQS